MTTKEIKSSNEGIITIEGMTFTKTNCNIQTQNKMNPYTAQLMPHPIYPIAQGERKIAKLKTILTGKSIGPSFCI